MSLGANRVGSKTPLSCSLFLSLRTHMVKESDSSLDVDDLHVESWCVVESYRAYDLSLVGVSSHSRDSLRESSRGRGGSRHG